MTRSDAKKLILAQQRSDTNDERQVPARGHAQDKRRQGNASAHFTRAKPTAVYPRVNGTKQANLRQVARRHPPVESVRITTADGTELAAEVQAPQSPRGAIIFVHGFCGNKGENGLFHALAERCVEDGFAAVLYDWRGIADSKGDFPSSTLHDHASDFEQVAQWTKSRFGTKLGPLHAVGFSLGAAVIGLALRRQLSLTSVAYLSPAARPRQCMWPKYNSEQLWRELETRGVVEKPGSSVLLGRAILESLRDTDLGPRAFDLKVPLLVCHGTDDVRIDCSHTRRLVKRIDSTSDFRYMEFEGASHSFRPAEASWGKLGDALTAWFGEALHLSRWRSAHGGNR
jgi:alpha-beta hydrolase superfamily lysophospholipase